MKHVLFLSYDGMTDPLGQSQVIPYLKGLTSAGYRFTILSCDKPSNYAEGKDQVFSSLRGFPINWVSIPYHKDPPVLSSIFDLIKMRKAAAEIHRKDTVHMVHTRPGIPPMVALWMKKKFGVRFVNDIRGFWADERVDGGMWNLQNPVFKMIYKFFRKEEDKSLRAADHNICLTYAAKKIIHSWKHIPKQPVPLTVIPCSADLQLFNPDKVSTSVRDKWRVQLGIPHTATVFTYLGSIGGWYLTDEMMSFCAIAAKEFPAAHFLFISPHRHSEIKDRAAKHGVPENRMHVVRAQREEVATVLSLSHFSFFFIKPCFSKLSSSPTKHGEIMAMGIPVITNSGVGDVAEIVENFDAGFVIDNFTTEEFQRVIREIKAGKGFDLNNIRFGAKEFYGLENAVKSYREVYDRVFRGTDA